MGLAQEERPQLPGPLCDCDHHAGGPVAPLVALWLLFFAHNSVLSWIRATMEEKNQQKEMARLKEEIDEMDREIRNLRNNPDTLETFARETYHFAAPGDDVYIVE